MSPGYGDYEPPPQGSGGRLMQAELELRRLRGLLTWAFVLIGVLTVALGLIILAGYQRSNDIADNEAEIVRALGKAEVADCNARKAVAAATGVGLSGSITDCEAIQKEYKRLEAKVD